MSKFNIKFEKNGQEGKVTLTGTIDEDVDFGSQSLAGMQKVELHLGGIKGINSCGIREWIKWMGTGAGAQFIYHECPKIIIDQINMVQGFLPTTGSVKSFYVPYYNEDSGSEKNVLFSEGKEFAGGTISPPAAVQDADGNPMEMDVVEAKYFKFLKK